MRPLQCLIFLLLSSTFCINNIHSQNSILNFDGIDDYVDLGNDVGNGVRTIELWFKPSMDIDAFSLEEAMSLVVRENSGNNINDFDLSFQPSIWPNSGKIRFNISIEKDNSYTVYSDQDNWNSDQWYHLAGVVDSIQGMMMFVDGIKQTSVNFYNMPPNNVDTITTLGSWGTSFGRYFYGSIDDVRFSSESLYSSNFIPNCPDQSALPNTIAVWNFNETQGDIASDSSHNMNNATIIGATRSLIELCKKGNAIEFDGVDDYVNLGNDVGNGVRTIEFWFKPEMNIDEFSLEEAMSLVVRENSGHNFNDFDISIQPIIWSDSGKIRFNISDEQSDEHSVYSDQNNWSSDQWYHVAGVIDSLHGMMMFIDGIKQQNVNSYNLAPNQIDTLTTLGSWGKSVGRYFYGSMDDIRFSSEAIYTENFTPKCPDQTTLSSTIGIWNFNGFHNRIAIDSSNNAYIADLIGPSRINTFICQDTITSIANEGVPENHRLHVFPNPSSGVFKCERYDIINKKDINIIIYNSLGIRVLEKSINTQSFQINLLSKPNDIYYYKLFNKSNEIDNGKLIKN